MLYKTYFVKDIKTLVHYTQLYDSWFFDQTIRVADQFMLFNKIRSLCDLLDIEPSERTLALRMFGMLMACSLYQPVVLNIIDGIDPNKDALSSFTYAKLCEKILAFYSGKVSAQLSSMSSADIRRLKDEAKNWALPRDEIEN